MTLFPATASELEIAYTLCNIAWMLAACINSGYSLEDMVWLYRNSVHDDRNSLAWQRFRNVSFRLFIALGASLVGIWAMTVPPNPSANASGAIITGGYFLSISLLGLVFEWWQFSDRLGMRAAYDRLQRIKERLHE